MKRRFFLSVLLVVVVGLGHVDAVGQTYTASIHGRDNTVREHVNAKIPMPIGTFTFVVSGVGAAD